METTAKRPCPYATVQTVLQGKWAILILHHLSVQPLRFNELHRKLPGITQTTLSRQLKQMELDGLLVRTDYGSIPPKVEYSLSEMGMAFRPILDGMRDWGNKYYDESHGQLGQLG